MSNKPDLIVGTWGMSAFDTAPTDFKQLISSLRWAGARIFDSALVYGNGTIDEHLGKDSDIKVITKIPALDRDALRHPRAEFSHHYPCDHIRSCVERLLVYHQGTIDTLLLHNWHPNWRFDQAREILAPYSPEYIRRIGVSAQYGELSLEDTIPIIELPIDPVVHQWDDWENVGESQILVRSPFCHGLLLKNINDTLRQSRFTTEQKSRICQFQAQYPTLSLRMRAVFWYISRLPLDIQGIIIGITHSNQWVTLSHELNEIYKHP